MDDIFDLYYRSAHRNLELEQTIEELQNELKYRTNENKALYTDNQQLNKELNGLYKDLEKANTEINRLKMIIDLKDDARVELVEENTRLKNDLQQSTNEIKLLNKRIDELILDNNDLKHRRKLLVKQLLNTMYGFDYADTDSIKSESEEKTNDIDN